jgi:hypothetical protein
MPRYIVERTFPSGPRIPVNTNSLPVDTITQVSVLDRGLYR